MKKKYWGIGIIVIVILLVGGAMYSYGRYTKATELTKAQKEIDTAITKKEFKEADKKIDTYTQKNPKDQSMKNVQKQVTTLETIQTEIQDWEIEKAETAVESLQAEKPKNQAVASVTKEFVQEVKVKVTKIEEYKKEVAKPIATTQEEANQAIKEIEPLTKLEKKGDLTAIVTQAEETLAKQKEQLETLKEEQKAKEAKEQEEKQAAELKQQQENRVLTSDEVLAIAKQNLPEYFESDKMWASSPSDDPNVFKYGGSNDGAFRALLTVKKVGTQLQAELSVGMREPTVTTYTWDIPQEAVQTNTAQTQNDSSKAEVLDTTNPQKYLDAYNEYSAKGINLFSYGRGGAFNEQEVIALGYDPTTYTHYNYGIEDYYQHYKLEKVITEEEQKQATQEAKAKLDSGAYAK